MKGERRRKDFLPFYRPALGPEEEREIIDTLRSGWITTGPKTERFEREFADYISCAHAIGVTSCTAGLHLALVALGIGEGDEVITSPITFVATANVIVHQRARPVFADVEPDTLNLDPERVEERITPKTRAIMPVHFAGHPCEMDALMKVARRHGLAVIEDAAHAVGADYHGCKAGALGDVAAFSFYATKNLTTGEGGMVTTNDEELAQKVRVLRLHGISQDAWKRYGAEGYRHWELICPGYKYNMFDLQAALGIQQLKKLEGFREIRKRYVEMYDEAFRDLPEIVPLVRRERIKAAYHLYVVLVRTEKLKASRDEIINVLQAENIGTGVHFRAVHLYPFYGDNYGFRRGDFPQAEYASDRVLSLPLFIDMTEEDISDVIAALRGAIIRYRR